MHQVVETVVKKVQDANPSLWMWSVASSIGVGGDVFFSSGRALLRRCGMTTRASRALSKAVFLTVFKEPD